MKIIYANTHEELINKMIGYYHDHCYHYYIGKVINVPDKYLYLVKEDKEYCFIYEETKPIIK